MKLIISRSSIVSFFIVLSVMFGLFLLANRRNKGESHQKMHRTLVWSYAAVMLASLLHAWRAATDPAFDPTPAAPADPS